ncbi:hypothetical protein ACQUW5_02350 [Legionella sp. CNM-1927-20]|uniref:hypothetical protein n=1 Tax=Legionella sp. CNM-1927-20 TaxID=3422221 RepID=UPI00403B328B
MQSVSTAMYNLERVKKLARDDQSPLFSFKRALKCVSEHLQLTPDTAKLFILLEVSKLTENNFCENVLINGDVYDVYGKRIREIPWYIKFSILEDKEGEYLYNISFHPTEKKLTTASEVLEKYSP